MVKPTDIEAEIANACAIMRRGGIIVYPTDTIWGIGCDARNVEAVERIYKVKGRAESKAMLLLVADETMLRSYVGNAADILKTLGNSSRPLTVVYPEVDGVASALKAADGSVGIRLTHEAFSSALCRELGAPIVSTSANVSGTPSPRCFSEISVEILDAVDYVVDYRRDESSAAKPSKVVKLNFDNTLTVIRP